MVATSLAQLRSSLTWTSQIWSQVLVDGVEWTQRHLGDLRMPLLVLHGVEDKMVLVSGSRWAKKTIKISPHLITFQGNCEEGSKPGQKTGDDPGMFDKCRFWLSWKCPQIQILGPNVSFIFFICQGASHHVLLDRPTLVESILLDWVIQRSQNNWYLHTAKSLFLEGRKESIFSSCNIVHPRLFLKPLDLDTLRAWNCTASASLKTNIWPCFL